MKKKNTEIARRARVAAYVDILCSDRDMIKDISEDIERIKKENLRRLA